MAHVDVPETLPPSVQPRLVRLDRQVHVHERVERLVVHLDQVRGAARGLGVVGRHDRHRLALIANLVDREHGLVRNSSP